VSVRPSAEFLGLAPIGETYRWTLPVLGRITGGRGSLFGGAGLAAGICALEAASGKPIVWATGQFLSITQQPVDVDVAVELPAIGRNVVQGRAIGRIAEREVFSVIGALGTRSVPAEGIWVERPDAPGPEDSDPIERDHAEENIHRHIETRLAQGCFGFSGQGTYSGSGRTQLWARMPGYSTDAGALAIIADYMPSVLGDALERTTFCTSLDNTIRFGRLVETDWVLIDNRMEYVGDGFGHGTAHMWSEDGTLMATVSQSMIVRLPDDG